MLDLVNHAIASIEMGLFVVKGTEYAAVDVQMIGIEWIQLS